jgi:long-chain acyl-CoA synthetase
VGLPIPGADIRLAADGEVLIRAPFVMAGYYRDPVAMAQTVDGSGWLHTGDLGRLDGDGFLTLTGVKKALFKLSTGKYVSPLPLEAELRRSPLVAHAVTVGAHQKFCGMLVFPNLTALRSQVERWGLTGDFETTLDRADALDKTSVGGKIPPAIATPLDKGGRGDPNATESARNSELRQSYLDWLHHPRCLGLYQALIDAANCHLPYWSTVRKFALIPAALSATEGLLYADGSVNRIAVWQHFAADIAALYGDVKEPSPPLPAATGEEMACPTVARSLLSH